MKADVKTGVKSIVLDIEGTTTPIAFVYEVLFPFARRRLHAFMLESKNRGVLREALDRLREEWTLDPGAAPTEPGEDLESIATYAASLMDQDRKSTGLKLLQGLLWEEGYRNGELKGEVFSDVAPALRRWREAGVAVAIYSSGSELAQRLLFGSTASGDLTPLLARFFDTTVGPKQAAGSYRRIARELGTPPDRMLFISDVTTELDAAHAAGCQVLLCLRPGNRPQPSNTYPAIESFDEVEHGARLEAWSERT